MADEVKFEAHPTKNPDIFFIDVGATRVFYSKKNGAIERAWLGKPMDR